MVINVSKAGMMTSTGNTHVCVSVCFCVVVERMEQVTKHCWETQEVAPRPTPSGRCMKTSKPPFMEMQLMA